MIKQRLLYLAALVGCGVFYIAYGQWLSFLVLVLVLALPWFSFFLSLCAMLNFRVSPAGPGAIEAGQKPELWLLGSCAFPMPPFQGKLMLSHSLTGQRQLYQGDISAMTDHCGSLTVAAERVRVCDYLGLFSLPVRKHEKRRILIRPKPIPMAPPRELHRRLNLAWRPKAGGGYAENHELRLYRPGDNLNQIHWKLSAKTGDLFLRQPMTPQQGTLLLSIHLRGTPEELDRMLGRLLWMGSWLLEQGFPFGLRALTGSGLMTFSIAGEADLQKALDALLCQTQSPEESFPEPTAPVFWYCPIGGAPDEA